MAKTSDVQRDLDNLKSDVENLRKHTVKMASDAADLSKRTVNSTVESSKDMVKNAAKTIRENPGASLAGAVGVGVILGGIVKRLFRRKKK